MSENQQSTKEILSVGNVIIDILKANIAGSDYSLPADVDFNKLYMLSDKHRVSPLVAETIVGCEFVPDEVKANFKKELFKVSMRYETQNKEREKLSQIFNENGIKFCFLKGYKLSRFYPNPEQRFSLDMDVWVEKSRVSDAQKILEQRGYEKSTFADDKDVGYIKKPFLNVEIHKELKYDYDKGYEYYKGAFSRLVAEEDSWELNMTNEDFYVYILSHSAHHFETAGTGIRNILDHYYLKMALKPLCNPQLLREGLTATGLSVFNDKMDALCEYWFGDYDGNDDVEQMAEFVLLSGVFGNQTNHYLGGILKGDYGNKKSDFVFARVFPKREKVKDRYPILKKAPFLLPLIWIVRIITTIFSKKDYKSELESVKAVSEEDKNIFAEFMKKNGL